MAIGQQGNQHAVNQFILTKDLLLNMFNQLIDRVFHISLQVSFSPSSLVMVVIKLTARHFNQLGKEVNLLIKLMIFLFLVVDVFCDHSKSFFDARVF